MEKANGLHLMELGSEVKTISGIEERNEAAFLSLVAQAFPQKAFVATWLHYAVLIGTWRAGEFGFHDGAGLPMEHILKLRVFDDNAELLVWRTRTGLKGRIRTDDVQGTGTHVVEASQVLFGTKTVEHPSPEYIAITEDRGTTLILPFHGIHLKEKDKKQRIFIRTHNYVEYDEQTNQATYTDCRFVRFCDLTGDLD